MFNFLYKKQRGFTFVELLISIGVFSVIITAIMSFTYFIYVKNAYIYQQAQATNEARKGIDAFARNLREAQDGEDGSYILESANAQELIFYGDINADDNIERVRYFLDGTDFKMGVVSPTGIPVQYVLAGEQITTLSHYVRNGALDVFTYYNGDYPADTVNNPLVMPASLMDVKLVHLFLRINIDPNRAPNDFDLETDVQIRNLKVNL